MPAVLETLAAKTSQAEWSALRYPNFGHKAERLALGSQEPVKIRLPKSVRDRFAMRGQRIALIGCIFTGDLIHDLFSCVLQISAVAKKIDGPVFRTAPMRRIDCSANTWR